MGIETYKEVHCDHEQCGNSKRMENASNSYIQLERLGESDELGKESSRKMNKQFTNVDHLKHPRQYCSWECLLTDVRNNMYDIDGLF